MTRSTESPALAYAGQGAPGAQARIEAPTDNAQQPGWQGDPRLPLVTERLARAAPLVTVSEVERLRGALADVAAGRGLVLQAGDCAESLEECDPVNARQRVDALDLLGDHLQQVSGRPVLRIGRMAGQFAKPRSSPVERVNDQVLPAFRGHIVNSEVATEAAREPDPLRMQWAYEASAVVMDALRTRRDARYRGLETGPWASHEALLMDYESSLLRSRTATGERLLTSTHLPWIGERTRQPGSPQMELMRQVVNAVACKIGPSAAPDDVLEICRLLDPDRVPGRLVLIVRMGRDRVSEALPPIVAAVRRAGHPVVWLCDPMHGNTTRTGGGLKTRHLTDLVAEASDFRAVLERQGQHAGGVHLEVAASPVTECVGGPVPSEHHLARHYTTLCDPRLNPEQARRFLSTWA